MYRAGKGEGQRIQKTQTYTTVVKPLFVQFIYFALNLELRGAVLSHMIKNLLKVVLFCC